MRCSRFPAVIYKCDQVGLVPEALGINDAKLIFQGNEAGHSIRAGAIHTDLAVVIEGHE